MRRNYSIKIIQHNVNRQDSAHQGLLQQALEAHADVILLQEPYLAGNPTKGFHAPGHSAFYTVLPHPTLQGVTIRPRVLIYIRKASKLEFSPRYDLFDDPDLQLIEVYGPEPFHILNLYNEKQRLQDSQGPQGPRTIHRALLHYTPNKPTVVAGDFNLHHLWWNCIANPAKASAAQPTVNWLKGLEAELLIDLIVIAEEGRTFYRSNLKNTSVIDLAFAIGFKRLTWGNWNYLEPTGSDHEVIGFQADFLDSYRPSSTSGGLHSYNYKKADWELFEKELKEMEPKALADMEDWILFQDWENLA